MRKKPLRLLALLLALSFVFTLAACGDEKKEPATTQANGETTTAAEVIDADTSTTGESSTGADESTEPSETVTGGETTDGTNTVPSTSATKPGKPTTIAEIVAYYNKAANNVRDSKASYSLTTTNIIGKISSSSSGIEGLANRIVPMFDQKPTPSDKPEGEFPVKGQSYGSKLQPSAIQQANCVEKGSTYEITLKFKDEQLNDLPKDPSKTNHGKALNVLTAGQVYEQTDKFAFIIAIKSFVPKYSGSYIECTIDKSTGHMKEATFYHNTIATVTAKPVIGSAITATVPFGIKQDFVIKH